MRTLGLITLAVLLITLTGCSLNTVNTVEVNTSGNQSQDGTQTSPNNEPTVNTTDGNTQNNTENTNLQDNAAQQSNTTQQNQQLSSRVKYTVEFDSTGFYPKTLNLYPRQKDVDITFVARTGQYSIPEGVEVRSPKFNTPVIKPGESVTVSFRRAFVDEKFKMHLAGTSSVVAEGLLISEQ